MLRDTLKKLSRFWNSSGWNMPWEAYANLKVIVVSSATFGMGLFFLTSFFHWLTIYTFRRESRSFKDIQVDFSAGAYTLISARDFVQEMLPVGGLRLGTAPVGTSFVFYISYTLLTLPSDSLLLMSRTQS
jgi:hypothetical protein